MKRKKPSQAFRKAGTEVVQIRCSEGIGDRSPPNFKPTGTGDMDKHQELAALLLQEADLWSS